jgi:Zn finger protein HypA/HybF involved in hydrogenase expression
MPATIERHDLSKTCRQCQCEFTELYDSYTDVCPECQMGHNGTLIHTEGGWIWQEQE